MQTSMVFLNRFLRGSPSQMGWSIRKSAAGMAAESVLPGNGDPDVAVKGVNTVSIERVVALLSQHMAQGVCIVEIGSPGAARVVVENAAFMRIGGLQALMGDRTAAQFAEHLTERLAAAAGKACVITASTGVIYQARVCADSSSKRVVIVCDPERRTAKERELLSTVAHEMRNGMSALCGAVEMLGASAAEDPKSTRALAIARRQLEDMRRFVDDLLSVGLDTKREFELTRTLLRAQDLVLETVETHGAEAERRGIRLLIQQPDANLTIEGDAGRLRQVLSNLFLNACKFTPAGGLITMSVTSDGNHVQLSVADTGSGIEPSQVASIFEPFGQEHYADDQSRKGLGIGLCVARQLVQLHGGRLTVRSGGRDCGSEFVVTLPSA